MKRELREFVRDDSGKPLTRGAQITNNINHDVESGAITTVAGLVSKYDNHKPKLCRNIGRAINERRWHIPGVLPNNSGNQTDNAGRSANNELGAMVIADHANKTITVLRPRTRRSHVAR